MLQQSKQASSDPPSERETSRGYEERGLVYDHEAHLQNGGRGSSSSGRGEGLYALAMSPTVLTEGGAHTQTI